MDGTPATPDFDRATGKLLLRLRQEAVGLEDRSVTFQEKQFRAKDEVHITIIGSALGAELAKRAGASRLLEDIALLIEETGWRYILGDSWHHVVRSGEEPAESIIRMVEVPALPAFYRRLERLSGLSIPPRPTHITLYTRGDRGGIGIATWAAFEELVVGHVDPVCLERGGT